MTLFHSSLWKNNIVLYMCILIYMYKCEIYHIFLMHSSVVEHLGYFHRLDIVSSAEINVVCRCFHCILTHISWVIHIGVLLLDGMVILFSV
jgi:hypothetical protein